MFNTEINPINLLFSRKGLMLFSIFILIVHIFIGRFLIEMIFFKGLSVDNLLESSDGSGTIIVAFGVMLECRGNILKWYRNSKTYNNKIETNINKNSEKYGILLLILGLLMEVVTKIFVVATKS